MRQMWREGLLGLTDGGFDRSCFLYDPRTGEVSAPPPGYVSDRDGKQMQDKHRFMCRQSLRRCHCQLAVGLLAGPC